MRERNETGTQRKKTRDPLVSPWVHASRVYPTASSNCRLGPARHRCLAALARDTSVRSRGSRMSRWPWPHSRCQTAQCCSVPAARCCARVCLSFASIPPGGVGGAPTGALFLLSRLRDATDPRRARRGASHDAGRSPLGAPPWRFSAGGRASISGIASGSVQRAPRSQVVVPGGRCPGPPEPAVTSRGRRTPLPAPPSGPSPEDAPP